MDGANSMAKPSHILAIYDGEGGIQTHVATLYDELRKRGFIVLVFSTPDLRTERTRIESAVSVPMGLMGSLFTAIRLIEEIRKVRVDLVHVHTPRVPLLLGYLLHRICKVPLIVTIHERDSLALKVNRLFKRATKIIAISHEVKSRMVELGVDEKKLVVIPNMIDTNEFSPEEDANAPYRLEASSQRAFTIVCLGRADSSKVQTIETAMKSMPEVIKMFPKAKLLIAGGGPSLCDLTKAAQRINGRIGKDAILVLGQVPSAVALLRRADVVIGIGRVALEAMATGKPVIAVSGQAGQLVRGDIVSQETATALAEYNFSGRNYGKRLDSTGMLELIARLLENEDYRKQIGSWGRLFVKQNFDSATIAKLTESVYSESLRSGNS
jgi:glycosyltransferase involved in cell wall biosynthesis